MLGISLHCFHQIRNQVVTPLEFRVDSGPGFAHLITHSDQTVVSGGDEEEEDEEDASNDINEFHLVWPPNFCRMSTTLRNLSP
ncbi:MAG: hypothetical protein H6752_01485 [Candidatus Omnitrophica bacterium]|nr:hypothetical protein [Candidatus Omnitrophota bacterium]